MSWIGVWLGLMVPAVEVAQQVSFTVLFPLTFSNVFVPTATLPSLAFRPSTRSFGRSRGSLVLLAIFFPLAVRRYRHISR
jgi:hypothetical protein